MNYGKRMKEVRTYDLHTQEFLAKELNITRNAYNQFENQNRIIPLIHLNNFCNYYNISIDYIFNLTNIKNYNNSNYNIDNIVFILRLKELRKEKKLSQKGLAIKVSIPASTISTYESNKCLISTKALYAICSKFNISADYLLGKIDTPKYLNSTKK